MVVLLTVSETIGGAAVADATKTESKNTLAIDAEIRARFTVCLALNDLIVCISCSSLSLLILTYLHAV